MDLTEHIKSLIRPLVVEEVINRLDCLRDQLLAHRYKPEFDNWGRFLNYDQTATYMGVSKRGLKKKLSHLGIHPVEYNQREKVFDRYELDRIKINETIEAYKNKIYEKW